MDPEPQTTRSNLLTDYLAAKQRWRKTRAALPMSEKVKVLEKLRRRNQEFREFRNRRLKESAP
jgi:hypothetical protein